MGQEAGLGVTHLSIALANYTSQNLKAKTALIEFGERYAFASLPMAGEKEMFQEKGVTYFPAVSSHELGIIYNMDFEYFIIDFGIDTRWAREELLRCNGKLIVGSLCPWRRQKYYDFIQCIQEQNRSINMYKYLALFGDKIEIKKCRRIFKVQVQSIPFIANPFCLEKEEKEFLHTLV